MSDESSEFLYHCACPSCGSHDALSVYSDGHAYCFSCCAYLRSYAVDGMGRNEQTRGSSDAESGDAKMAREARGLILDGEYVNLTKRRLTRETLQKFGYTVGTYSGRPVQIAPY